MLSLTNRARFKPTKDTGWGAVASHEWIDTGHAVIIANILNGCQASHIHKPVCAGINGTLLFRDECKYNSWADDVDCEEDASESVVFPMSDSGGS